MMTRKKLKSNHKMFIVLYTLLWSLCVGALVSHTEAAQAQPTAFEGLAGSLRDPFAVKEDKTPLQEQIAMPVALITPPVTMEIARSKAEKKKPVKKSSRPKLPKAVVTGLIFKTTVPQVILNGAVLNVGDVLDGIKILKIKAGGLMVRYRSNIYFIKYGY